MTMFTVWAAVLASVAGPHSADAPLRAPTEVAENVPLTPEMQQRIEQTFKEQGISPAGILVLMSELGRSGPNEAEQAASARLQAGMNRWETARTHASPNAVDVVNAARDGRAATRAFIDLMAAGRERILLQLSPPDLKIYLNVYGALDTKLMLGMF